MINAIFGFSQTAVVVAASVVVAAYIMKPTDDSFGAFIAKNCPIGTKTATKVIVNSTSTFDDFVLWKIAHYPNVDGNSTTKYIGIMGTWNSLLGA